MVSVPKKCEYLFASAPATSPLGLHPRLRGLTGVVEATADCVEKRLIAVRAADQLAPPHRDEGRFVRGRSPPLSHDIERLIGARRRYIRP